MEFLNGAIIVVGVIWDGDNSEYDATVDYSVEVSSDSSVERGRDSSNRGRVYLY